VAFAQHLETVVERVSTHALEGKRSGVFWLEAEVRTSEQGEVIDRRNPLNLVNHIESRAKTSEKKKRAFVKGLRQSYSQVLGFRKEALGAAISTNEIIRNELNPSQIRIEFQKPGSQFAAALTEYYFAVANRTYEDDSHRPSDEIIALSLDSLVESTDPDDHVVLRGLVVAANVNAEKRMKHHQGSAHILEAKSIKRLGVNIFESNFESSSPDEIYTMTRDHARAVDDLIESRQAEI